MLWIKNTPVNITRVQNEQKKVDYIAKRLPPEVF